MTSPPPATIDDLKNAVDTVGLISTYTDLRQSGATWRGVCPLHGGSNPSSFVVYPDKHGWHCFGDCAGGGDVIRFVQIAEGMDFRQAVEFLAERAGVEAPPPPAGYRKRSGPDQVLVDATAFWRDCLAAEEGTDARAYLELRGISPQVARAASVGFCPHPGFRTWEHLVDLKRRTDAEIVASKLYDHRRHTLLTGRLVIPIFTKGRITNLYGRAIVPCDKGDRHRYIDAHHGLYGLDQLDPAQPAVLVEGILDALALRSAGVANVLATYGTGGLSEEFAVALAATGVGEVVVFYDGDTPGKKAALVAARRLRAAGVTDRIALTPAGEDPASLVAAGADVATVVATAGSEAALTAAKLVRDITAATATDRVLLADALDRLATIEGLGALTSEVVLCEIAALFGLEPARIRQLFETAAAHAKANPRSSR